MNAGALREGVAVHREAGDEAAADHQPDRDDWPIDGTPELEESKCIIGG